MRKTKRVDIGQAGHQMAVKKTTSCFERRSVIVSRRKPGKENGRCVVLSTTMMLVEVVRAALHECDGEGGCRQDGWAVGR
jgi:hypothetical protein